MKEETEVLKPCFTEIPPINDRRLGQGDLLVMVLGSMGRKSDWEGDFPSSTKWEWFDPTVLTMADYKALPPHWQSIVRNMNGECWSIGYRFVHCPEPVFCYVPGDRAVSGIFCVARESATHEDVRASDLIHLGGQLTEYDTNDKCIWMDYLND